jgi:glycosyltransferase involved in cell wall biosynthesis
LGVPAETLFAMEEKRCPVDSVAVLLCTFNGDRFIDQQMESILRQQGVRVHVFASDDGSSDQTLHILNAFRGSWGEARITIFRGPRCGYVANFFSLICAEIEADYFAYADQDDVWDSDKLSRAIAALSALGNNQPALYCCRTRLITRDGAPLGLSPDFKRAPTFANALIQNIGNGNTMVLNRKARDLIRAVGPVDVPSHDWWTYILVAAAGGAVLYDSTPCLSYRQHPGNLIGSNITWGDRLARFSLALQGRNRAWNTKNLAVLMNNRALLSAENLQILEHFSAARDASLLPRLWSMWRSGVYAQSIWGNLGLIVLTFLKKL